MNKVISKDGTSIVYDRVGEGPALINVLGATATRGMVAQQDNTAATTPFTVYTYDRRGRGDSGDTAPYAVQREIEDLEAMIDAAGGSAFVFGHSSGAVLALRSAGQLGNKITKLALYEPPFILDDSRPPIPADYVAHLRQLIASGRPEDALAYFMTVAVGIPAEYMEGMKQAPFWASSVAVAHTISYDGEIMGETMYGNPAALASFAAITTPTLVMVGSNSPPYQQTAVETLAKVLLNAHYRSMAGQDHGIAPEVLNPALMEFFLGPDDKTPALQITRKLAGSPEQVFDALTNPAVMSKWMYTEPDTIYDLDLRVGGQWSIINRRDGVEYRACGLYLAVERPHRLVYIFGMPQFSPNYDLITIAITTDGDGSLLSFTHSGVDIAEELRQLVPGETSGSEQGWAMGFDALAVLFSR